MLLYFVCFIVYMVLSSLFFNWWFKQLNREDRSVVGKIVIAGFDEDGDPEAYLLVKSDDPIFMKFNEGDIVSFEVI